MFCLLFAAGLLLAETGAEILLACYMFGGGRTMPQDLKELLAEVRRNGRAWSSPQALGAAHATVRAAWTSSEDPFAMLLLLAALHPQKEETVCDALVASMFFFSPMRTEAEKQALARPGMNYNGPDRFRFLHLAAIVRTALSNVGAADRRTIEPRLSTAIRSVIDDPYALARPD